MEQGKSQFLVLDRVRVLESGAHTPLSPPPLFPGISPGLGVDLRFDYITCN